MERSLFQSIIDTLRRHEVVWDAMGKSEQVLDALMKKSQLTVSRHYTRFEAEACISIKQFLGRVKALNTDPRLFQSDVDGLYKIFESHINIIIEYTRNYTDENSTEARLVEKSMNQKQLDSKETIECKNLVRLLRLLLLQDGDNHSIKLPLSTMEIQVLKSYCEELSHKNEFIEIISAVFQKLAIIEHFIDSKDPIVNDLIQLRVHFSRIEWFRQLCIINTESVYDRFVKGKKLSNNKEVEKRILNIIQAALRDDKFWLCMDQIMLIDSDDITPNFSELPKVESLKNAVINWLWDEIILKKEIDCGFLSKMIKGIREDVSIELFEKGLCILKKCTELVSGIEEIFRSLLHPLNAWFDKKLSFCDALLNQIKKIQEDFPNDPNSMQLQFENQDNVYVSR
ncbi:19104_t:CDS:2 [Racocetra fulgida]|uniref:19104_t:CDS:1 n=1 Tax=Racocetra fulgida TaxID=60492 RepID=A0A9N9B978_9GLOM|nr:19104_t:CDS:2 [Racocetra fulgida]